MLAVVQQQCLRSKAMLVSGERQEALEASLLHSHLRLNGLMAAVLRWPNKVVNGFR